MLWYVARRCLWAGFASVIILTVTFLLMELVPNQQLQQAEFAAAASGADVETVMQSERAQLGLDQSRWERYTAFMTNVFEGDWGWSRHYDQPVYDVMVERLPYSMMYGVPAIVISTILGTVIGLYSAVNQYTKKDYAATFFAFFGVSIPNFWFGIVLAVVFGSMLGWFPLGFTPEQAQSASGDLVWLQTAGDGHPAFIRESFEGKRYVGVLSPGNIKQLVLPTIVLTTGAIASVMRYSRAEALEYVDAEFVKTAKSKGVKTRTIVAKHIFKPASVPLMTIFVGRILGIVLVGSLVIEIVFSINGYGLAAYYALRTDDTDLVAITILLPTFVTIVGNLIEDISYAWLDPRIELGDRS